MKDQERSIYQILSSPGFARDGTMLDKGSYIAGQWTRFQRTRPKKIGGYKEISSNVGGISRGCFVYAKNGLENIYGFGSNKAWASTTTQFGATSVASETVIPSLAAGDDYTFQVDAIFDALGSSTQNILMHPAKNLLDIADETNTPVYFATAGNNPISFATVDDGTGGTVEVSGGVVVLQPFIFAYGNNGLIKNSNANNPNSWEISVGNDANEVNVAGTKIVKGLPYRAGSNAPAGLFWSLDSLIRVSRSGTDFRYDTVSAQTTIISPHSVVEYDGVYYWIGVDRFFSFNGTVNEVPNNQNYNWFFDNVNYAARTKIWGYKNTRFGEIWWFFPLGNATECNYAIIYNIRENVWYDCQIARSSGFAARVLRYPVLFGNEVNSRGMFSNFVHEFGKDAVQGGSQLAIPAYFETSDFGYPTGGASGEKPSGNDVWTRLTRVEPDFVQSGAMTVQVLGEEFAKGTTVASAPITFESTTEKVDMREQRRHIRLRFESNVVGGDFEMGRVIIHTEAGDARS